METGTHSTDNADSEARHSTYQSPRHVCEVRAQEAFPELAASDLRMAPPLLYMAGDLSLLSMRRVSIVGSRSASPEGLKRAAKLARQLARAGIVVVSGLAKGIDTAAHQAAIEAGGRTLAVIGTPLQRAYPADNAPLQERIYREHLLISQFASGQRTFGSHFVQRNRTMAMLSHASVIVEAGETSGSLSQAAETQRIGRTLFIMRNVLANSDLQWPHKFLTASKSRTPAQILDETAQILRILEL